jgi:hypothetical protein
LCCPGGLVVIVWPNNIPWLEGRGYTYRSFEGYIELEFSSLEEALEIGAVFYPQAVAEIRRRGERRVPYDVLGVNLLATSLRTRGEITCAITPRPWHGRTPEAEVGRESLMTAISPHFGPGAGPRGSVLARPRRSSCPNAAGPWSTSRGTWKSDLSAQIASKTALSAVFDANIRS